MGDVPWLFSSYVVVDPWRVVLLDALVICWKVSIVIDLFSHCLLFWTKPIVLPRIDNIILLLQACIGLSSFLMTFHWSASCTLAQLDVQMSNQQWVVIETNDRSKGFNQHLLGHSNLKLFLESLQSKFSSADALLRGPTNFCTLNSGP